MNFYLIQTYDGWKQAERVLWTGKPLGVDFETCTRKEWYRKGGSALDPHTGRISLAVISDGETVYVIDVLYLEREGYTIDLYPLLAQAEYVIGANFKFDLKYLRAHSGKWLKNARCVVVLSRLLGNATGSKFAAMHGHSLGDLCRDLLDVFLADSKHIREEDWAMPNRNRHWNNPKWREMVTYAANDGRYLHRIHDILWQALTRPLPQTPLIPHGTSEPPWGLGMDDVCRVEMRALTTFARLEYNGIPVSRQILDRIQRATEQECDRLAIEIAEYFNEPTVPASPRSTQRLPRKDFLRKLNSHEELLKMIRQVCKAQAVPNTQTAFLERAMEIIEYIASKRNQSEDTEQVDIVSEDEQALAEELEEIETSDLMEAYPIIEKIVRYKRFFKQKGMDLRGFINPATGRIHPNFNPVGAATGRASANSPNLQQCSGKVRLFFEIPLRDNEVVRLP